MFMQNRRRDDGDAPEEVRFLIDLDMSALGALQLDGLVHGKRFDLMVRSHTDMPEPVRIEITRIFEEAIAATGMTGSIFFQTVSEFAVSPLDDVRRQGSGSGEVIA